MNCRYGISPSFFYFLLRQQPKKSKCKYECLSVCHTCLFELLQLFLSEWSYFKNPLDKLRMLLSLLIDFRTQRKLTELIADQSSLAEVEQVNGITSSRVTAIDMISIIHWTHSADKKLSVSIAHHSDKLKGFQVSITKTLKLWIWKSLHVDIKQSR